MLDTITSGIVAAIGVTGLFIFVIILSVVAGLFLYKYVLNKYMPEQITKIVKMIPWIGTWLSPEGFARKPEGFNLAPPPKNLYQHQPDIRTSMPKTQSHGIQCLWDPKRCNQWSEGKKKLEPFTLGGDNILDITGVERQRNKLFRSLQEPIQGKLIKRNTNTPNVRQTALDLPL